MRNRAQRGLQELLDMQSRGQAAIANQQKIMDSGEGPRLPASGKAKFSTPEALATAVGAGWLLGPVGGILMGVAQGILGKREQQSALDQFNRDNEALSGFNDVYNSELDQMLADAKNPDDVDQVRGLQAAKDAALKLASSGNPDLQAQGVAMLDKFQGDMTAYQTSQEAQRIAADTKADDVARQLTADQNAWYVGAQTRFRNETAPYKNVMKQTDIALDALANGTPSDLWAAIKLVNKALDQSSAVMEGEVRATEAIGGYKAQLNTFLEQFRSGAQLGSKERKDLMNLMGNIRETETSFALATEIDYRDQMDTLDMPAKFYDDFRAVDGIPAVAPGEFNERSNATDDLVETVSTGFTDDNIMNNIRNLVGGYAVDDRSEAEKAADLQQGLRSIDSR